jgi:hypothetical protein
MPHEETHAEPSVVAALGRAIDAGQRIVVNRVDLVRLEILDTVTRAATGGVLAIAGAVIIGIGWLACSGALILYAEPYLTLAGSAAVIGAVNVLAGIALLASGVQRARPDQAGVARAATVREDG